MKTISKLLEDDELIELQVALAAHPDSGNVVPKSGGLRKIRWGRDQTGKRGGIRIIYYWAKGKHMIYLLVAYRKSTQDTLSASELRKLSTLVRQELK